MFTGIARAVRIIVVLALSAGISGPKNTAARAYAQERATAQTTLLDKYPGQLPLPPSVIKREDLTRVVRADTKTERTPLPKPVEDPIQPSGEITKPLDAPLPEPRALQFVAPTNDMLPVVSVPGDPSDDKLQVGSFWTRNYTYDSVGNVTSAADASETLSYSYDALARLKGVSGTYTETYTYDDIGNLKDKGDPVNPGVQLGYPAAMQARPHAPTTYIPTQNGSYQTYWYDNNGNMTWRDEYSPGQTYMAFWQGYTPDNKLYIAVGYGWNAGAGQWEFNNVYSFFYYDADGNRVRKDDPNGTTAYAGPGFEQNAYTGVQRVTYSFNGQVVAVRNGATTSWIHSDHLGSASLATDYTGVPIAGSETRYTPWGEVRTGGVGAITDRGFTSQRREDNIRLNDYVARFYNPFIGKFIQPDSIVPGPGNPQSFNRYAYGFNSPLKYTDPSGHDPLDANWERDFRKGFGRDPNDEDRRSRLFSLLFKGSTPTGDWDATDWNFYNANKDALWSAEKPWKNGDSRFGSQVGLASFTQDVKTLASYYKDSESAQFVRGFASIWGGVPYSDLPVFAAASTAIRGKQNNLHQLWEGARGPNATNGWYSYLVDKIDSSYEQGHHYAYYLFVSYTMGSEFAWQGAQTQDNLHDNSADVILGFIAIGQGKGLYSGDIKVSGFAHELCVALGSPTGGC